MRRTAKALLCVFCVGLAIPAVTVIAASTSGTALAQERPQTLMDLLFRNRQRATPAPQESRPAPRATAPKTARTQSAPRRATSTPVQRAPEIEALPKSDNARKVLVIGDFTAASLAGGLVETYLEVPDVVVIDAANGSSGLVRDDFYDWPGEISAILEAHQPAVVVSMIGANDRQALAVAGTREPVRSPAWLSEYERRARALAEAVTARRIPLVWVGQVPYRFSTMSADMLAFNGIYQSVSSGTAGAVFVDVWDGFVDEEGRFATRGPDVNGQIVALRSGDVNLTRAGARKLAFYAERELSKILGDGDVSLPGILTDENLPVLSLEGPGLQEMFERLRPVSLDSPGLDGGETLLGDRIVTPDAALIAAPAEQDGRINDFRIR